MKQSEIQKCTSEWLQARESACEQVTIGFGFTSYWLRKWRECFFNQSQSAVTQNQSISKLFRCSNASLTIFIRYLPCNLARDEKACRGQIVARRLRCCRDVDQGIGQLSFQKHGKMEPRLRF